MARDDDSGEYETKTTPRTPVLPRVLAAVGMVPWVLLGIATLVLAMVFFSGMSGAKSAVQEASIAASTASLLIGCYLIARCAEKVLGAVVKLVAR